MSQGVERRVFRAYNNGMKARRGRPPKKEDQRLGDRLYLRLSAEEKKRYDLAASKASVKLSEWIRRTLDAAASRVN